MFTTGINEREKKDTENREISPRSRTLWHEGNARTSDGLMYGSIAFMQTKPLHRGLPLSGKGTMVSIQDEQQMQQGKTNSKRERDGWMLEVQQSPWATLCHSAVSIYAGA